MPPAASWTTTSGTSKCYQKPWSSNTIFRQSFGLDIGPITPHNSCVRSKLTYTSVRQTTWNDLPPPCKNWNETCKAFWEFYPPFCLLAAQTRQPPFFYWAFPSWAPPNEWLMNDCVVWLDNVSLIEYWMMFHSFHQDKERETYPAHQQQNNFITTASSIVRKSILTYYDT